MRNAALSVLLMLTLVGVVLFGADQLKTPAEAATPVAAVAQAPEGIGLCIPPLVCTTIYLPGPTVRLPGVTIEVPGPTVRVSVPVTVRVPPVRVTEIVTLPPVRQTIIVPRTVIVGPVTRTVEVPVEVPGQPGRTVTAPGLPAATTTATVVVSQRIIQNGTQPPVTQEVRRTVSAPPATRPGTGGQNVTTRVTVSPSKEVIRLPGTTTEVTRFEAVGLSLLGLLALMGLGLTLLWLGFILGYRSSEKENISFLKALRDTVRRRPGKHE